MINKAQTPQPSNLEFYPSTPQALRGELSRAQALERLDNNPDARLIVIAAPSGYGKTTLAAQYARANSLPVLWCDLREAHQDPEMLERTLRTAFERKFPDLRWIRSNSVLADGMPVMGRAKAFAQDISTLPERALLVFDGCEFLSKDSENWLNVLLDNCYAAHRFILIGLETPNIGVSKWLARGEAVFLGERDLAFSSLETEALFRSRGVQKNVYEIHRQLEGWAIGLSLVASSNSFNLDPAQLIQEALNQLDSELYACVPELAVLSIWNERTITELGLVMPQGWLECLRAVSLPLIALGNDTFRPHSLLTNVLEKLLAKQPQRAKELWGRGAVLAEQQRDLIHAIRLYRLSGDLEQALVLADPLVTQYEAEAQDHLVLKILGFFASHELSPKLKAILGISLYATGELERGEALVNEVLSENPDNFYGIFFKAIILHRQSFFNEALKFYNFIETKILDNSLKSRFLRLKSILMISLNDQEEALRMINLAIEISYENNNLLEVARSLSVSSGLYSDIGFWKKSEYAIENALEIIENLNSPKDLASILNNVAFYKFQLGKYAESENFIKIADLISNENELFDTSASIFQTKSSFFRFKFQIEKSEKFIKESIRISNKLKLNQILLISDLILLEIHLIQGKFDEFNFKIKELEFKSRQTPSIIPRINFHKAQMAFFKKDYELADQLFATVESSKTRYLQIARARVYRLECSKKLHKNIKEREAALEETLTRCGHQVLQWDAPIFEMLQENPSFSKQTLEPQETPNQALKLEISTLGNRIVRINEEMVKISLSKSFELLVWLALHGASRRETMIDALWDGANDPRYGDYFKVAMKRLRSALAEYCPAEFNPIKLEGNQYQINSAFEVHFDLTDFQAATSSSDLEVMELGLRQYQGSFMPGLDTTWIETERNHALEEALNLALKIGKTHPDPQRTALAFEAAIRFDPLCEEAYVKLIDTLKRTEQPEAATRAFRMYSRMMREELGLEPEMILDRFPK
jgi:LuxR family transcriptional regulator, maltose regulon positive regulatory protein